MLEAEQKINLKFDRQSYGRRIWDREWMRIRITATLMWLIGTILALVLVYWPVGVIFGAVPLLFFILTTINAILGVNKHITRMQVTSDLFILEYQHFNMKKKLKCNSSDIEMSYVDRKAGDNTILWRKGGFLYLKKKGNLFLWQYVNPKFWRHIKVSKKYISEIINLEKEQYKKVPEWLSRIIIRSTHIQMNNKMMALIMQFNAIKDGQPVSGLKRRHSG